MKLALKLAYKAIELINEQVNEGIDIDGNKYKYSEKPYWRPYSKKIADKLGGKNGEGKLYNIVAGKTKGKLGMIILGGYKAYRSAFGRDTEGDFLQFTGNMLAALDVISSDGKEVEIGFNDKKAADIAFWLNVSGAGRSRKLWKFMGLTAENQGKLADLSGIATNQDIEDMIKGLLPKSPSV